MTEREALKLALEALENAEYGDYDAKELNKAITAIKEALAQPEQEPVAMVYDPITGSITPLQRKPLTNEEERKAFVDWCFSVGLMAQSHGLRSESSDCDTAWKAWKARAAHGIKGEA